MYGRDLRTRKCGDEKGDRRLEVVKLLTVVRYCAGGFFIFTAFQH